MVCERCGHRESLLMPVVADARLIAAAPDLLEALADAAAALAVVANHAGATHPGLADADNLHAVRGFALEAFHMAKAALAKARDA